MANFVKYYFLFVTAIMLVTNNVFAQLEKQICNKEVDGIYFTISDFKTQKLTRSTDKKHKGDKIKLKQFFISPKIISIEQKTETVFNKDSIFAIQLLNGDNYRFINRTTCLIADTSYLYIYTYKTIQTIKGQSGPRRTEKQIPITTYYFSYGNHKEVFLLTMVNLRKKVLTDVALHTAICNKFTNDEMLFERNNKTGRFVLNETILSNLKK